MMAALAAAGAGAGATLLEQNEKLGKKLYITGKGRCNLTNASAMEEFTGQVVTNPKFLYSAFSAFTNKDIMDMVSQAGCPLKTERGSRVFPVSDKSSDVIRTLSRLLEKAGVRVQLNCRVTGITEEAGKVSGVSFQRLSGKDEHRGRGGEASGFLPCDAVVLACGGLSYPSTGSDGSGFALAGRLGHTQTPCRPALTGLVTRENWPNALAGLTLKNISVRFGEGRKPLFEEFGELLFTHDGVSGPVILTASSVIGKVLEKTGSVPLWIDLKPALTPEKLENRLLREFEGAQNRKLKNVMGALLPSSLIEPVLQLSGIDGDMSVNQVSAAQRRLLSGLLKAIPLTAVRTEGYQAAIITQGGIPVKEISPKTMESRLIRGLYFAGEMIDVDALTGGYNLQIAWSTGALAGASAAAQIQGQA